MFVKMRKATILGAIAGDIIGSVYEFHSTRRYDFELFNELMRPTDDTVMTLAVAEWILTDPELSPSRLTRTMREWGRKYPRAGYGGNFRTWLNDENAGPYYSWGNGSAMRVSPVGFAFDTLDETLRVARLKIQKSSDRFQILTARQAA